MAEFIYGGLGNDSCPMTRAEAGSAQTFSEEDTAAGEALYAWIDRTILKDPTRYPPDQGRQEGPGWTGVGWKSVSKTFLYFENSHDMHLSFNTTWGLSPETRYRDGRPKDPRYRHVQLSYCAFVPGDVRILSTSGSAAAGYYGVQYVIGWKPTAISNLVVSSGLKGASLSSPPQPVRGSATFRRDPAGGWRVARD